MTSIVEEHNMRVQKLRHLRDYLDYGPGRYDPEWSAVVQIIDLLTEEVGLGKEQGEP